MLVVTTPAPDPTLLTSTEVAEALGESHGLSATALQRLNERVSELLAGACGLDRAGAAILTLRQETLTETVWMPCNVGVLFLSRKPVIEVLSVNEVDTDLTITDDYIVNSERSLLRMSSSVASTWAFGKSVISYKAGYATVPPGLKELAAKLACTLNAERGRDPSLGSEDIPGVRSATYRYGKPDDPLIPSEIMEGLRNGGFMNSQNMVG